MSLGLLTRYGLTRPPGGGAEWTDNPNEAYLALTPSMLDGVYQQVIAAQESDTLTLTPSMLDGVYQEIIVAQESDTLTLTPSMLDGVYQEA